MGNENWERECREWSHEVGTAEIGRVALEKWEFTATWRPDEEGRHVDICIAEY